MAESQKWIAIQGNIFLLLTLLLLPSISHYLLFLNAGIEAMIEQGLAQSRAWLLNSAASPFQGARKELGQEAEANARLLVRGMDDIQATTPSKL